MPTGGLQFYYAFANPFLNEFHVTNAAGKMTLGQKAPADLRAAAQGLIAFVTLGVGMFIGSIVSGRVVDRFAIGDHHAWMGIWLVPAAGAAGVLVLFAVFFRENNPSGL